MFGRRASQRPSDDLVKSFKAHYPRLGQNAQTTTANEAALTAHAIDDSQLPQRQTQQAGQPSDPAFRSGSEQWGFTAPSGFTPSLMDPNSQSFSMFANQMPGYYTPTPGGNNTLYHNQAGDLHTPGFSLGLGTPLSLSTSEGGMNASHQFALMPTFQPPLHNDANQPLMQSFNPFQMHQQHAFPQQHFGQQSTYEQIEHQGDDSPMGGIDLDAPLDEHASPDMLFHPQIAPQFMQAPAPFHPSADKFRFHATLNAQTAMTKNSDEIPVTYLNKGQAYILNVVDTIPQQSAMPAKYRTFVRVSFEDEEQRQKPAACWQLWKEGRGSNEAHQRGGKLQAVEFVDTGFSSGADDSSKPMIELESHSFDGFCVVWSPSNGRAECPLSVRFNFLSTDFSHSKGVKGVPVRLCAKTEALSSVAAAADRAPEVCYCKVKLFRDHGAERKLSNDVAHVKKTIEKLKQQIAQVEAGAKDSGKRKRSGSFTKAGADARPAKVQKHKRTWSTASATSNGGRSSAQDELHVKLTNLQDMFSSTRPASVLYLKGDAQDDPDLFPVRIVGEAADISNPRVDSIETTTWDHQSLHTVPSSATVSPVPSNKSLDVSRRAPGMQLPTPISNSSRMNSASEWRSHSQPSVEKDDPSNYSSSASPLKIQTTNPPNLNKIDSAHVDALGIDPSYKCPEEQRIKPVACFYVKFRSLPKASPDAHHRAIYLMRRSLKDFENALATRFCIEPTQVHRTVRTTAKGLTVLLDDECIRELPEGQDMVAEYHKSTLDESATTPNFEDVTKTEVHCDGEGIGLSNPPTHGYELRLHY